MLLTLAYKLNNVCNASFSRHTNHAGLQSQRDTHKNQLHWNYTTIY